MSLVMPVLVLLVRVRILADWLTECVSLLVRRDDGESFVGHRDLRDYGWGSGSISQIIPRNAITMNIMRLAMINHAED